MHKIESELNGVAKRVHEFARLSRSCEDSPSVDYLTEGLRKHLDSVNTNLDLYSIFLSELRNRSSHHEIAQVQNELRLRKKF